MKLGLLSVFIYQYIATNMSNSYHILWIDDEWDTMTSFKKYCKLQYNMELTPFKTQKEGLDEYAKNPSRWEAVILDAKVLDENEHEVANIGSLQKAVMRIKEQFKELPYFISTGQPDLLSDNTFKSIFPIYYEKEIDDEKLCQDIIKTIDAQPNRIIKNKYPELFSKLESPIAEETLSILKIYEARDFYNADVFNKVRKILDWVMPYLYKYGLLAIKFTGTNLNECSKFLGNKKLQEYVPVYIQRHLYTLVTVSNDGSHRQKIDEEVKTGKASYLVASTIFELLNVLNWLYDLPKEKEEKEKMEKLAANIAFEAIQSNNKH